MLNICKGEQVLSLSLHKIHYRVHKCLTETLVILVRFVKKMLHEADQSMAAQPNAVVSNSHITHTCYQVRYPHFASVYDNVLSAGSS